MVIILISIKRTSKEQLDGKGGQRSDITTDKGVHASVCRGVSTKVPP